MSLQDKQQNEFSEEDINRFEQLATQLHGEQNLPMGLVGGVAAAIIGGVLWAAITVATGWQLGLVAVGIGFLVGYAVSYIGKGITPIFGYMGAGLALLGVVVGKYLTMVALWANATDLGYIETFTTVPFDVIKELVIRNFSPIDLLFYGIAIYQGYKLSFTDLTSGG